MMNTRANVPPAYWGQQQPPNFYQPPTTPQPQPPPPPAALPARPVLLSEVLSGTARASGPMPAAAAPGMNFPIATPLYTDQQQYGATSTPYTSVVNGQQVVVRTLGVDSVGRFMAGVSTNLDNVSSQAPADDAKHYVRPLTLDCASFVALGSIKQVLSQTKGAKILREQPYGYIYATAPTKIQLEFYVNETERVVHFRANGAKSDYLKKYMREICQKYWPIAHSPALIKTFYEQQYRLAPPPSSPQQFAPSPTRGVAAAAARPLVAPQPFVAPPKPIYRPGQQPGPVQTGGPSRPIAPRELITHYQQPAPVTAPAPVDIPPTVTPAEAQPQPQSAPAPPQEGHRAGRFDREEQSGSDSGSESGSGSEDEYEYEYDRPPRRGYGRGGPPPARGPRGGYDDGWDRRPRRREPLYEEEDYYRGYGRAGGAPYALPPPPPRPPRTNPYGYADPYASAYPQPSGYYYPEASYAAPAYYPAAVPPQYYW